MAEAVGASVNSGASGGSTSGSNDGSNSSNGSNIMFPDLLVYGAPLIAAILHNWQQIQCSTSSSVGTGNTVAAGSTAGTGGTAAAGRTAGTGSAAAIAGTTDVENMGPFDFNHHVLHAQDQCFNLSRMLWEALIDL